MSRIGKQPIPIPQQVTLKVTDSHIVIEGPKGTLQEKLVKEIGFKIEDSVCTIEPKGTDKRTRQMYGLYRQLVFNMVQGVSEGFSKTLLLVGVGYRAEARGKSVMFNLGYSTSFEYVVPEGISIQTPKQDIVIVEGISKQQVGQVSAEIRSLRKPEPYKGKGIKYSDEIIRRKEGKTGKK